MADPILSIYVSDKPVQSRLKRLQQKTGNLEPAFRSIGEAALLSVDRRFETETGVDGRPWKANSPRTIAQKRAEGRINKVLQSTGIMRARTAYTASRDRLVVGNSDPKARKHQLGIGVPKREFLGFSEDDIKEAIIIVDEFLAES